MSESKSVVGSAAKTLAVLRAFTVEHAELTISEVGERAGLDRGTSFRFINTLVALGYLALIRGTRRYRLTLMCLDLGYTALALGGLRAVAAPALRDMVPELADAASLGTLLGSDVVYVERIQSDMGRRDLDRRTGSRTGAYASALGHVLLAWLPPEEARAVLASGDRVRLSERTVVDMDALMNRLATVRTRGYATADGENAYGLRTIAAPVLDVAGHVRAGISLTIRNERQELDAFVAATLPSLTRVTADLTAALHKIKPAEPARHRT